MTQKEQRLSQPSWTFRLGRVLEFSAELEFADSKTGAARSSVWAKMSETKIQFSVVSSRFLVRAFKGTKVGEAVSPSTSAAKAASELEASIAALKALRHPKSGLPSERIGSESIGN